MLCCWAVTTMMQICAVQAVLHEGGKWYYNCIFCTFHLTWIKFCAHGLNIMLLSKCKFHDIELIWSPTILRCINECLYFAHILSCLDKYTIRDMPQVSWKSVQWRLYFCYEHKWKYQKKKKAFYSVISYSYICVPCLCFMWQNESEDMMLGHDCSPAQPESLAASGDTLNEVFMEPLLIEEPSSSLEPVEFNFEFSDNNYRFVRFCVCVCVCAHARARADMKILWPAPILDLICWYLKAVWTCPWTLHPLLWTSFV